MKSLGTGTHTQWERGCPAFCRSPLGSHSVFPCEHIHEHLSGARVCVGTSVHKRDICPPGAGVWQGKTGRNQGDLQDARWYEVLWRERHQAAGLLGTWRLPVGQRGPLAREPLCR